MGTRIGRGLVLAGWLLGSLVGAVPRMPLRFVKNAGQWPAAIQMVGRSEGLTVVLRSSGMSIGSGTAAIEMQWETGAHSPQIEGRHRLAGEDNEFFGADSRHWRTHLPAFAEALVRGIGPGVDLLFYAHPGMLPAASSLPERLEFDLRLRAGTAPESLRLRFPAAQVHLERGGRLVLDAAGLRLQFGQPRAYQSASGRVLPVSCRYRMDDTHTIHFACRHRDPMRPLVIDPTVSESIVTGSRYLGGVASDTISTTAVDAAGNLYVAGTTASSNFTGGGEFSGLNDAFVVKLDPGGSNIVFTTYLGGSDEDDATGIALASDGTVFLSGATRSGNFPVTPGVFQPTLCGNYDAFVTHLSADGSHLLYSTYLGGTNVDWANAIAVDASGSAIVAGYTLSTDYPVQQALQRKYAGGARDAFMTRLSPDGKTLTASTWLGGSGDDVAFAVAVDATHHIVVAGSTTSPDFPVTPGAMQGSLPKGGCQGAPCAAGFLTELTADGAVVAWSSVLAGSGSTALYGVAMDASGNVWSAGATTAGDLPFPASALRPHATVVACGVTLCHHGFVARWQPDGSSLAAGTYLAGSGDDFLTAITLTANAQELLVAGQTTSPDFPATTNAPQTRMAGTESAVAALLDPLLQHLWFSSYWGGTASDQAMAVALNGAGDALVAGRATSPDLPVTVPGAAAQYQGSGDGFLWMFQAVPTLTIAPASVSFANQRVGTASAPQPIVLTNGGLAPLQFTGVQTQGDYTATSGCGTVLPPTQSCSFQVVFQPTVRGARPGLLTLTDSVSGSPQTIPLTGTGVAPVAQVNPPQLDFTSQNVGSSSPPQTVSVGNAGDAPMAIASISVSGDFSIKTDCTASVAPNGKCTVQVVFSPTAPGARTGALAVTDDADGNPHTVALQGTGVDFTLTVDPGSQAVMPGKQTQYTLTLTPQGGFQQTVALACSGAPATVTCTLPAATEPLDGVHPITETVTVATTAASWQLPRAAPGNRNLPLAGLSLLALLLGWAGRWIAAQRRTGWAIAVLTAGWLCLAGCGGGGGGGGIGGGGSGPAHPGTPAGSYSLLVTASAGSLQHTATITLQVQ